MEIDSSTRRVVTRHLNFGNVKEVPEQPRQPDVGLDLVYTAQRLDQIRSDYAATNDRESNADLKGFAVAIAHDKAQVVSSLDLPKE